MIYILLVLITDYHHSKYDCVLALHLCVITIWNVLKSPMCAFIWIYIDFGVLTTIFERVNQLLNVVFTHFLGVTHANIGKCLAIHRNWCHSLMGWGVICDLELGNFLKILSLRAPCKKTTGTFGPIFGRFVEQVNVFEYA